MPRIPSAANVNPVGAAAARLPSVRAGAGDFGVAAAGGLASFGAGLDDLGVRLSAGGRVAGHEEAAVPGKEGRLAGAEAKLAMAKSKARARAAGQALIDEMKRDGASRASAAEAVKRFDRDQAREQADLMPKVRDAVKAAVVPVRTAMGVRAARAEHNLRVTMLAAGKDETLALLSRQAAGEPSAAALYAAEGLDLLGELRDAGALTSQQFAAESDSFRRGLFAAVVRARPAGDAMADLEKGAYDDALGDPELKWLLQAETTQRLASERTQAMAQGRWLVDQARRGVAAPITGTALDAAVSAEVELAQRVRSELESLRYAPVTALLQGLATLPSARGTGSRHQDSLAREELRIQSEAILRERRDDPAAFVMGQPTVAKLFAEVGTSPQRLPAAVEARLAAQEAMGLTADRRSALTKDEAAQILAGLQGLEAAARGAALVELGRLYGDQSSRVAAELAEAGLTLAEVSMVDAMRAPATAGRYLQLLETQELSGNSDFDRVAGAVEKLVAPDNFKHPSSSARSSA